MSLSLLYEKLESSSGSEDSDYGTQEQETEQEEGRAESCLLKLPNEIITWILRWTDFESREALRDVCVRLRFLVEQSETAISLQLLSFSRRHSLDTSTFAKYHNLRVLDLAFISKTSMQSTMMSGRTRNLFADQVAANCLQIQDVKVQGINGCKWLTRYCKALKTNCKIRKLDVDMVQGYAGCVTALNQCLPAMKQLVDLRLSCSHIRRSNRFQSLTDNLFSQLDSRLQSFVSSFGRNQYTMDEFVVANLSGLQLLQTGVLSSEQVQAVKDRNPSLRILRLVVTQDTVTAIPMLQHLERLSITLKSELPHLMVRSSLKSLQKLKVLEIKFDDYLPHYTLIALDSYVGRCSVLRVLIVRGKSMMTYACLVATVQLLPQLTELLLPDLQHLTNGNMILRDISSVARYLASYCPGLERIVTAGAHFERKNNFQSVKKLHSNQWSDSHFWM